MGAGTSDTDATYLLHACSGLINETLTAVREEIWDNEASRDDTSCTIPCAVRALGIFSEPFLANLNVLLLRFECANLPAGRVPLTECVGVIGSADPITKGRGAPSPRRTEPARCPATRTEVWLRLSSERRASSSITPKYDWRSSATAPNRDPAPPRAGLLICITGATGRSMLVGVRLTPRQATHYIHTLCNASGGLLAISPACTGVWQPC